MSEYVVVFERAEDGGWGAYLPDLMRGRNLVAVFAGLLASCGGADDALVPRDLDPVPRRMACAEVYGGPGTARVTGELRSVRVSAEFDLTNACEIARWRRNAALLGAPGVGHGAP